MRVLLVILMSVIGAAAQMPPIEPGVSHDLAIWRALHYSDVRYKLNLTLEKMSPILKGTIEIRVKVEQPKKQPETPPLRLPGDPPSPPPMPPRPFNPYDTPIVLDWRKIPGHEKDSTISNVTINGMKLVLGPMEGETAMRYVDERDHLLLDAGVVEGENVIKLDFTSPILTSGSAITRYVDKEDGAEYIYSLFVPSDASTAFPVFDQPDLKARFSLSLTVPKDWNPVSNTDYFAMTRTHCTEISSAECQLTYGFGESLPISTYVFAFGAGPFKVFGYERFSDFFETQHSDSNAKSVFTRRGNPAENTSVYIRKSQAAKFQPHAAEVFRLTREGVKYLETYFDYKFPWPKYDLVLIPEFPFGGMEHAGATFLRESSVIFPTEPTKNDQISRANLIFHETAHQWFGDTVTMKWFDDLWLKEGFAEFMAYKTLEKVMPSAEAWKVFYERNKQAAYQTDSTRGTTPIYQEIANLSAAKSAYGNIVYRKAPSFLRQAEFYLGEDKFQTAVRAFLKKHEYANAGWEDLVKEFETASSKELDGWGSHWVKTPGLGVVRLTTGNPGSKSDYQILSESTQNLAVADQRVQFLVINANETRKVEERYVCSYSVLRCASDLPAQNPRAVIPNYQDYGYGIFLLDDKSRDYVLKNIQNEKDPFLRTMMWGSLWDSVREAELDPKDFVELLVKNLATEQDESTIQTLLGRVSTAMNYYISGPPAAAGRVNNPTFNEDSSRRSNGIVELQTRLESLLIDRIQNAPTAGQRITFYRAFLGIASTERARNVLKQILRNGSAADSKFPLKSKDRFDIVTRLMILGDPEAPKLLADLEKTEIGDDAKRYAYAAKAGAATAENKDKFWNDFLTNKDISESWIEAAMGPFNSIRHASLTQQYLERSLAELPNLKRSRKIFFVNGWLGAFIGGQRDEKALAIVNKFLADNPDLDKDLRLKVLENVDIIERAVKIRAKFSK